MRRALIVIGKAPVAGRTKTRLVPPLSADAAAALYAAFLTDTLRLAKHMHWERTSLVHPRGDGPLLRTLVDADVHLLEQPRAGLEDALAAAFDRHFQEGFQQVILIGSDNPTLSTQPLHAAAAALHATNDVAIGPTTDGGYYLIGMRRPHLGLFEHIEWSTPSVYAQTLARIDQLGLRAHHVSEWYDVDEPVDLDRLQRELADGPPGVAPDTRAVLARLTLPVPTV